jgi:hypothetical protein
VKVQIQIRHVEISPGKNFRYSAFSLSLSPQPSINVFDGETARDRDSARRQVAHKKMGGVSVNYPNSHQNGST